MFRKFLYLISVYIIFYTYAYADDYKRLLGKINYTINNKESITIYNTSIFVGVFVQKDKNNNILGIHLVNPQDSSFFASQFTDPKKWYNTVLNQYEQTKSIMKADWLDLAMKQANPTQISLSEYSQFGTFYIGGHVSLILNSIKTVADMINIDESKNGKFILYLFQKIWEDQTLLKEIELDLSNQKHLEASKKVFSYAFDKGIEYLKDGLIGAVTKVSSEVIYNMAIEKYGFVKTYAVGDSIEQVTSFITSELDKVQFIANGLSASVTFFAYSNNDILFKEKTISLNYFNDLDMSHWSYDYIHFLVSKNIIHGYGNGDFGVNNPILLGELSKIIIRTFYTTNLSPDADLNLYLNELKKKNIIQNINTESLNNINNNLTRRDIAILIKNILDDKNKLTQLTTSKRYVYADDNLMSEEEKVAIYFLLSKEIMEGYKSLSGIHEFGVNDYFTRAQLCKVIVGTMFHLNMIKE